LIYELEHCIKHNPVIIKRNVRISIKKNPFIYIVGNKTNCIEQCTPLIIKARAVEEEMLRIP
jgi:hypothetical protein